MRSRHRFVVGVLALWGSVMAAQSPTPSPVTAPPDKPDKFSPLGFYDLRAYEQAFPAAVGDPRVAEAAAGRYWVFQGLAYRGLEAADEWPWVSLGPETSIQTSNGPPNVSGRVAALAISPTCRLDGPCRLWVGAAGGGVWRTDDAMNPDDVGWRWIGRGLGTNNIGSLALDPNDATGRTIYVGTGETNSPHNSGAGTGLYRSVDGGDHWTRVPTMITDPVVSAVPIDFTFTRGIAAVAVRPGAPDTIYVATATAMLGMTAVRGGQTQRPGVVQPRPALYKTTTGGASWTTAWVPPLAPVSPANPHLGEGVGDTMIGVRHVVFDPRNPDIVYAAAWNNAIHRSASPLENGDASFKPIYAVVGARRFRDLAMFDVTVKDDRTRLYVYNGTEDQTEQALYRVDNADVAASSLATVTGAGDLVNTSAWIKLTSNDRAHPGSPSRNLCRAQCFYDLVVAVPGGEPDTVLVGGVAALEFGDATIRSTTAGASFLSFSGDGSSPRQFAHVDVRAIVFHPENPDIAFVGSDGGVVRNDGRFESLAAACPSGIPQCRTMLASVPSRLFFLNKGLQTLQFYNVALDPQAPLTRLMGGLQDNSTIWRDGTRDDNVWTSLFPFGDGTSASGFHPTRPEVLFASFQSNFFFTNFQNGALSAWVRTHDPIVRSGERDTITASTGRQFITFDSVSPDTQWTGFQHVWRTTTNGGDRGFLEATCRFFGGSAAATCGDWVPLGVTYPFAAGTSPDHPSRQPGDLTSGFYGADRVGGLIVAAERAAGDAGTLWAATSFGRLFVSSNADAPGADVAFARIDPPTLPTRFVTRIVVSRADPNVAYISYSGFNTLTPAAPGHVFRATYNPATGTATFASLDFDLGDLPINTLAFDDLTGDLYAATDFGPLVLRAGATAWRAAGIGFPEALMVDLEIAMNERVLVAATHGLGIFYMKIPLRPALRSVRTPRP
ncbi:MAG TPA: hypothetical protein VMM93_13175 [Vicinamibacterales bacterium]|nr:hypothetical protein [Vicinamibacterales bacterium]